MGAAAAVESAQSDHGAGKLTGIPERFARSVVTDLLSRADVALEGNDPWSPRVHTVRALARVLVGGTLGAGESYVDGDWDCDALDELTARVCRAHLDERMTKPVFVAAEMLARAANFQTMARSKRDVGSHYDRGNDLYEAMLGRTLAYSCGYWRDANNLDDAQDAKHDLVCKKLDLRPGQRVLDIGCGFGGFARRAAERCGVTVKGVTISHAQAERARVNCAGLPVDIELADYRSLTGSYDRVVVIGMFEHVGPLNHRPFFAKVKSLLADDGLCLVQTIGTTKPSWRIDPWINRYIFPHAVVPAASQVTSAAEDILHVEDWHSFGTDYDRTLMAWCKNFDAAWPSLAGRYGERFRRLWRYYLLTCAGTFRARKNQLWQIVLSKNGVPGGYRRAQ